MNFPQNHFLISIRTIDEQLNSYWVNNYLLILKFIINRVFFNSNYFNLTNFFHFKKILLYSVSGSLKYLYFFIFLDVVNQNFRQIFIIQLENFSFLSFYIFLVSFNQLLIIFFLINCLAILFNLSILKYRLIYFYQFKFIIYIIFNLQIIMQSI